MSAPSARSTVQRLPERGAYDRQTIDAILDEGYLCHLGIIDNGAPVVIPTSTHGTEIPSSSIAHPPAGRCGTAKLMEWRCA